MSGPKQFQATSSWNILTQRALLFSVTISHYLFLQLVYNEEIKNMRVWRERKKVAAGAAPQLAIQGRGDRALSPRNVRNKQTSIEMNMKGGATGKNFLVYLDKQNSAVSIKTINN